MRGVGEVVQPSDLVEEPRPLSVANGVPVWGEVRGREKEVSENFFFFFFQSDDLCTLT